MYLYMYVLMYCMYIFMPKHCGGSIVQRSQAVSTSRGCWNDNSGISLDRAGPSLLTRCRPARAGLRWE